MLLLTMVVFGTEPLEVTITPFEDNGTRGISGLSEAEDGTLWAVAERQRPRLLRLSADGARVVEKVPVFRVPWGFDLESVDWLDDELLVFGTEHPLRGQASVLLAKWNGERVRVVRVWKAGRGGLNERVAFNHGFEGICASRDFIAVASETRIPTETGNAAQIYLIRRSGLDWYRPVVDDTFYLPIPTNTAISALHCGENGQLSAIVRGQTEGAVFRALLQYTIDTQQVELFELAESLDPHNLEGLIADDDGGWWALSDAAEGEAVWVELKRR